MSDDWREWYRQNPPTPFVPPPVQPEPKPQPMWTAAQRDGLLALRAWLIQVMAELDSQ